VASVNNDQRVIGCRQNNAASSVSLWQHGFLFLYQISNRLDMQWRTIKQEDTIVKKLIVIRQLRQIHTTARTYWSYTCVRRPLEKSEEERISDQEACCMPTVSDCSDWRQVRDGGRYLLH